MGEGLEKGDEHPAYNRLTDTDSKMRSSAYIILTCHLHAFTLSKTTVLQSSNNPFNDYKTGYTTQCHPDEHPSFTKSIHRNAQKFRQATILLVLPVNKVLQQ